MRTGRPYGPAINPRRGVYGEDRSGGHRRSGAGRCSVEERNGRNAGGHRRDPSFECGHRRWPAGHHCRRVDAAVAEGKEHQFGVLGGMGARHLARCRYLHAPVAGNAEAGQRGPVGLRRGQADPGCVIVALGGPAMANSARRRRGGGAAALDGVSRFNERAEGSGARLPTGRDQPQESTDRRIGWRHHRWRRPLRWSSCHGYHHLCVAGRMHSVDPGIHLLGGFGASVGPSGSAGDVVGRPQQRDPGCTFPRTWRGNDRKRGISTF